MLISAFEYLNNLWNMLVCLIFSSSFYSQCRRFFFLAKINSVSVYASTIIQDLTRLLCYYPGAFHKTEQNGQYSSRYVCREGTICYVALDETYRNCYFVDFRRSELLG